MWTPDSGNARPVPMRDARMVQLQTVYLHPENLVSYVQLAQLSWVRRVSTRSGPHRWRIGPTIPQRGWCRCAAHCPKPQALSIFVTLARFQEKLDQIYAVAHGPWEAKKAELDKIHLSRTDVGCPALHQTFAQSALLSATRKYPGHLHGASRRCVMMSSQVDMK